MTERENILNYLGCKPCKPPKSLMFTGPDLGIVQHIDVPICERPMFKSGFDVFGVHWTEAVPASHYTPKQPPIFEDIDNWREQVRFPKLDKFDWDYVREQAQKLDRENKIIVATMLVGPFERTTCLSSFEDCLVNAISEPEAYAELISAIADYKIGIIERLYEAAAPDVINLHDDWGTSTSTFFSPELWRKTIKPHTKRIYDAVHERGMLVCQHSCGTIGTLIGDMAEIGCDIWEGQSDCNDFPALREKYGDRICIITTPEMEEMIKLEAEGAIGPWRSKGFKGYSEKPEFLCE